MATIESDLIEIAKSYSNFETILNDIDKESNMTESQKIFCKFIVHRAEMCGLQRGFAKSRLIMRGYCK